MGRILKFMRQCLATFILILFNVSIYATTYYISPGGNDSSNGTSPQTAWKTISKLNNITLQPGDYVLFQAGYSWREELEVTASGTKGNLIHYGRYGEGPNPRILGSIRANNWTATGTANVWVSGTTVQQPVGRNWAEGAMLIYVDDSITHANERQASLSALNEEFEWYYASNRVYLYSPTDPDTRYDSVEVQQRETCMTMNNNQEESWIEVNGIDLLFAINAGFSSGYPGIGGKEGLVFKNCKIGYIGIKGSSYGYGVEGYHANSLFENCYFSDCGRRAISWNMYIDQYAGEQIEIRNLIIRNNIFKRGYHTTSLDCSSQLSSTDIIDGVYFYNNVVDDSEIKEVGDWRGSNQIFIQNGSGDAYTNNIYVVGNVFIQSTARNILYEGADTTYTWNNTIIGHNPNTIASPYANVAYNGDGAVAFYQNNILYDNLGQVNLDNHGIMIYDGDSDGYFATKDNNLYYSLYPGYGGDRNFSAHTSNTNPNSNMGYWNTNDWSEYLSSNSAFDQHSPSPQDPMFIDYTGKNFNIDETSAARSGGAVLPMIIVTDPFGIVDTITKYDIAGNPYDAANPAIGAYEYYQPDPTEADIKSFELSQQTSAASINTTNATVSVKVPYGTSLISLRPSVTISQGASVNPVSGASVNLTNPVTYTVTAQDGTTTRAWTVSVTEENPSAEKAILSFSIPNQLGTSTINTADHTVAVTMPFGTNLASLSPSIGISADATINPASGIARDFSSPVSYTVTAQDGTTQSWIVNVASQAGSSEKNITAFSVPAQLGNAAINTTNHTVVATVLYGTNRTSLAPSISVSSNATINPASGTARDFSTPLLYTVTAQDGSTQAWTVSVNQSAPSTETNILTFSIPQETRPASINNTNRTVTVQVGNGTDVTSLQPAITVSSGATVNPASGETIDFSSPVTYIVTAQDGTTSRNYTVNVSVAEVNTAPEIQVDHESTIFRNMVYTLDASSTTDADGDDLSFEWIMPTDFEYSLDNEDQVRFIATSDSKSSSETIVLNVDDGIAVSTGNIEVAIVDYNPDAQHLSVSSIEASGYESGNSYENLIDNSLTSRWSCEGDSWVVLSLANASRLSHFMLSYHQGDQREAFFDIEASSDSINWENVISYSASSGLTTGLELFIVDKAYTSNTYKYLRFNAHMNSANDWNSINELVIMGNAVQGGTGIEEAGFDDVFIYPNPTYGPLNIELKDLSRIRIFDLSGSLIYDNIHNDELVNLNLENYKSGLYLIEIIDTKNNSQVKKLIKQ